MAAMASRVAAFLEPFGRPLGFPLWPGFQDAAVFLVMLIPSSANSGRQRLGIMLAARRSRLIRVNDAANDNAVVRPHAYRAPIPRFERRIAFAAPLVDGCLIVPCELPAIRSVIHDDSEPTSGRRGSIVFQSLDATL
jgi:hypothetical protein